MGVKGKHADKQATAIAHINFAFLAKWLQSMTAK